MGRIVLGTGPVTRPIANGKGLVPQVELPVLDGHTCCGLASDGYCGPPWMRRVVVVIRPVLDGPAPSALDATGQALHCIWQFPNICDLKACICKQGIRRVPDGSKDGHGLIFVESNGGSFRIPRCVILYFGGGAPGSQWDVDVMELLDHNWGHPDLFALDTFAAVRSPIVRPDNHTTIQPLIGSLVVNGVGTIPGSLPEISLASPSIVATAGTLYRTWIAL